MRIGCIMPGLDVFRFRHATGNKMEKQQRKAGGSDSIVAFLEVACTRLNAERKGRR
jgi:hypothetical protein